MEFNIYQGKIIIDGKSYSITELNNMILELRIKSKELDISNQNIKGILDLKEYPNLEYLNCSHNQITKITNIPPKLKYIDCSYNSLPNLDLLYQDVGEKLEKNNLEIKSDNRVLLPI